MTFSQQLNAHIRLIWVSILGAVLFSIHKISVAAPPDPSTTGPVVQGFSEFIRKVNTLSNSAIDEENFQGFVTMLFMFFVILMIMWNMFLYVNKRIGFADVFEKIILILMVQVLMSTFAIWTGALWATAEGVASSLQNGMIGTTDSFFAPTFISNILRNMTFPPMTILNPLAVFVTGLNMILLSVAMLLLSMISYVSIIWGFWGFTLAKLVGLVFIPTLLYERLSWLFDGWLRFFMGFLIYYIIARLNVVMVACSLAIYFGVGIPFSISAGTPVELPMMASIFDAIGVFTFMFVGILSLFSTGKFAATIVSGAAGGGMGSAAAGAARTVAKLAF